MYSNCASADSRAAVDVVHTLSALDRAAPLRSAASALAVWAHKSCGTTQQCFCAKFRPKPCDDARAVSARVCVPSLRFLEFQCFLVSYDR